MEGDEAMAPLVLRVAGNATGGVPGLRRLVAVCLASSAWGDEAREEE